MSFSDKIINRIITKLTNRNWTDSFYAYLPSMQYEYKVNSIMLSCVTGYSLL